MAGNNLTTYLVLIRSHTYFSTVARRAVCYFRQGYRGLLVTADDFNTDKLPIVRRSVGNLSKDPDLLSWCQSNLLKEVRQHKHASTELQAHAIDLWTRSVANVADAQRLEEEARLELARAHRGQSVTINGRVYYPTAYVTKDGRETIQFFENDGKPNLDTV